MVQSFKIIGLGLIGIFSFRLVLSITFVAVHNYRHTYTTSLTDLADLGNLLSGTFGVVLSGLGLGVSMLIAYYLYQREEVNNIRSIETQKHVAMMQFRFSEVALYRSECDQALKLWFLNVYNEKELETVETQMDHAFNRLVSLFPELQEQETFRDYPLLSMISITATSASYYAKQDLEKWANYQGDDRPDGLAALDSFYRARNYYYAVASQLVEWANR